ncbi:MAG: ferrous iron transport protein A [Planctomycetia bacterium]|nr:MAG: ferrous iron transport protein A [Planctomycetia bacterium]
MSLARTPVLTTVRVSAVRGAGSTSTRLMEMGVIEGAEVCVLGRAPLGDPMHVRLGDWELSLRACDAELVDVRPA